MSVHAERVATRYLEAAVVEDPKALLKELRRKFDLYDNAEKDAERFQAILSQYKKDLARGKDVAKPDFGRDMFTIMSEVVGFNQRFNQMWGISMAILQTYSLSATLRKKVEKLVKFWATKKTNRRPRLPRKDLERTDAYLTYYLKYLDTLRAHFSTLEEALSKGREIAVGDADDPVKVKAGPFTLINMGGFPDGVMDICAKAVKEAASEITTAGLGKVCYGEVHISQSIDKGNVLAFYVYGSDEFFVRADKKIAAGSSVRTIIHELGHRYENKFLKNKRVPKILYNAAEDGYQSDFLGYRPERGDTITDKGETYEVTYMKKDKVHLRKVLTDKDKKELEAQVLRSAEKQAPDLFKGVLTPEQEREKKMLIDIITRRSFSIDTAEINLFGYLRLKGIDPRMLKNDFKGFITPYAKTSPDENFAEMFAFYCLGELPPSQAALFEELVVDA